jgi:hypothetical protein
MAWCTLTNGEIAALIGARSDVERAGGRIIVSVIDAAGHREAAA